MPPHEGCLPGAGPSAQAPHQVRNLETAHIVPQKNYAGAQNCAELRSAGSDPPHLTSGFTSGVETAHRGGRPAASGQLTLRNKGPHLNRKQDINIYQCCQAEMRRRGAPGRPARWAE